MFVFWNVWGLDFVWYCKIIGKHSYTVCICLWLFSGLCGHVYWCPGLLEAPHMNCTEKHITVQLQNYFQYKNYKSITWNDHLYKLIKFDHAVSPHNYVHTFLPLIHVKCILGLMYRVFSTVYCEKKKVLIIPIITWLAWKAGTMSFIYELEFVWKRINPLGTRVFSIKNFFKILYLKSDIR